MAETRKFPHHLIREIFEQPDALRRTIEPRVSLANGLVRARNCALCGESTSWLQEPVAMPG
jgi:glucosamine 6-phosphate synthetase-like amidotransferase/phosphosugar isomerase protein